MLCQLIPKRISAERRSPRLLQQQTEGAMSSISKPAIQQPVRVMRKCRFLRCEAKTPYPYQSLLSL